MSDLLTLAREFDLPPKWDGRVAIWHGWEPQTPAFFCPPPWRRDCCTACGSAHPPVVNRARVALFPRTTVEDIAEHDETRNRLGRLAYKRPSIALWRLHAFRCQDCRHDVVWDTDTDEWWDLDHTDYGREGSRA